MKRRIFCLMLALILGISCLLSACANSQSSETKEEKPVNILQQSDPAQDDTLNILMIGNSFCYYYVDELYEMLAADGIKAQQIDVVIIDQLPAQYIVDKNSGFKCLPLYYAGGEGEADSPTEEQYAICVTKGNTELLDAINAVLTELMVADENGQTEVDKLLMKHMGLE